MKAPDRMEWMQLLDGELPEERARAVREHLEAYPESGAELSAWAAVGEWVRQDARFQQDPGLTDAVLLRIGGDSGGRARWRHFGRGAWALVAGGALAAAAALGVWLGGAPPREVGRAPGAADPVHSAAAVAPASLAAVAADAETVPAVAIESIDFGTREGAIFVVGEAATPVVWLSDDDLGKGGESL